MHTRARYAWLATGVVLLIAGIAALAQPRLAWFGNVDGNISTPRDVWGHDVGDDEFLATYTQLVDYWRTLERQSPRLRLVDIGPTGEGRRQVMAIVTAPEHQAHLDRYKDIARRLARADGLTDADAKALAREGKAVVWIDGGIHADEVLGAQQLIALVYHMVSGRDEETERVLDNVILLAAVADPDGMDLVSDWYMKHGTLDVPVRSSRYGGHDNNRDFYMSALVETANMNRVLYREWYPQIVYDHHQTAPAGTVMVVPPFRDPANDVIHPRVLEGIDLIGRALADRFAQEQKPGVSSRDTQYSTWWNGGLRTTPYFHNMIGILTETRGGPTPTPDWRFRQSVEYSMSANRAVLDYTARSRERLLLGIYEMGRDQIRWGSEDHWTPRAHRPDAATARRPEDRDPRSYIIPAGQADMGTATKFVNALSTAGIDIGVASTPFRTGGRSYPAGSFIVSAAQAFRPHLVDMFEPQDYPDDFAYPGAPPTPPYDNAGYTLAYQMGVVFDRVFDDVNVARAPVSGPARAPEGHLPPMRSAGALAFSHVPNDAVIAVNRLLRAGEEVQWPADGPLGRGTFVTKSTPASRAILESVARATGLDVVDAPVSPPGGHTLRQPRIALYDEHGGSIAAGWTRLILDSFEFPYEPLFVQTIDAGHLRRNYDVIVFSGAGLPGGELSRQGGSVTAQTVTALREFVEAGGTLIAMGDSARGAVAHLALPVTNALAHLRPQDYYVPGSLLRVSLDNTHPLAAGLGPEVDVVFDNSPVFWVDDERRKDVQSVAWFSSRRPLRSGWAWGAEHLEQTSAVVDVRLGMGRVFLVGPDILFRAQSHGTFKLFFNALYLSAMN